MKDVYVITGATGGMGLDIALAFDKNVRLVLVDLEEEKLIRLQQKLQKKKVDSAIVAADITNDKDIKKIVNTTKQLGNFKVLIHTAGISNSMGSKERILEVNLLGTQKLMDEFYKIANKSLVINISSSSAYMVPDSFLYNDKLLNPLDKNFFKKMRFFVKDSNAAYAMSKKGVNLISEKAAIKWAKKDSRVVSISPGAVKTPLLEAEMNASNAVDAYIKATLVKRAANPNEITKLVDEVINNEYINGVDLLIDGGVTANIKHNDVFGLKANKVNKIFPLFFYMILFYVLPSFLNKINTNILLDFKDDFLYLVFPLIVALITSAYSKKKMSLYLIVLPYVTLYFSEIFVHNFGAQKIGFIYVFVALLVNFFIYIINKYKK